jgi:hypothetical protein
MKNVMRTLQDPDSGVQQWEWFTTASIPLMLHHATAFEMHYMLNVIPRATMAYTDKFTMYYQTTNMIHAKGILINL